MQLSTLVILYNTTPANSPTLQSILDCDLTGVELTLHIWNNGPKLLQQTDIDDYLAMANKQGICLVIHQDVRNIALSKIYNFIMKAGAFDFFIPFDQDSRIENDFFITVASHAELDLILPRVESNGQPKFPYYVKQGPIIKEGAVELNKVTSINSGIAISKKLALVFEKNGLTVFDERFAFYGIDTAFFLTLWALYKKNPDLRCGCYGKIQHSLAMDEEEEQQGRLSYGRGLEYLYFFILYRLHYKKRSKLSVLFHVTTKVLKGRVKGAKDFIKVMKCIFQGRHPRSELSITKEKSE